MILRNVLKTATAGGRTRRHAFPHLGKTIAAAACALTLAVIGCAKSGDSNKIVAPNQGNKNPDKLDTLLKNNAGKGVVTGYLTGEGKNVVKGILSKQAANAAGERRFLRMEETPLTGATILIFDALNPTTAAETTLTTDAKGNYTCVLKEGKYFGFAVYLDLQTFQLVTTSIPNMNPKADSIVRMDTATALEDVTAPTVSGVYDANSANSDGIFLVGSIPDQKAKLNITFSEPMNRESAKGVVLGRIDTANTSSSMVLADTVKDVAMSWSGDSKELTLSAASLTKGVQYGLIIPVSLKDLAKNPLEKEYKATFMTVAASELAAVKFAVTATSPADKESIKPIQNPAVSFNRPVGIFSLLKGAKIDPPVTGYWEVSGARAMFIHKDPFVVGKSYTVTIPAGVADLAGQELGAASTFGFSVKDFDGAAKDQTGPEKQVALAVEAAFDAYLSGDVGRFAVSFHPNFRMYDGDGSIRSKTEFLDKIRAEVGEGQSLAAGILAPVFDNSEAACKDHMGNWKVNAVGGDGDPIWVSAYVDPGMFPAVYDKDHKPINAADLAWDPTGPRFTIKATGKKYGFGPDMSQFHGPVNMDAAKNDVRFMSDVLKQTSTVALEPVKLARREEFKVDQAVKVEGDSANLMVKMIHYEAYNRTNFRDGNSACGGKPADTSYQILRFNLRNEGGKWLISSIVSPLDQTDKETFDKGLSDKDFEIKQILPITLTSPTKENSMGDDGKVTFRFKGPAHDSIGGYLVGIAEDPKFCFVRPPFGALVFVKATNHKGEEESFVLNGSGIPEGSNATAIMRRVQDLRLPGWDRAMFENPVAQLYDADKGIGGVYNWKAIAVKDTSAAQFLANGFAALRYYAESDFGPARGYFACKAFPQGAAFDALQEAQKKQMGAQPVVQNNFNDMDADGVPDAVEAKYLTNPRDRNSYPDFRVDTDGDGLADFLEAMLDPKGEKNLVTAKADAAGVKAEIDALIKLGLVWQDSDSDGFPDDIEMMSGFNPLDPRNNPGTRPRANAPIGVFAGKFQSGSQVYGISLKLYADSTKNLWVAYTAALGKDTLADTLRTTFNEGAGEVYIPVILPLNGPDAGKAFLLRGRFDAISSLLMGPVDIIPAPAEGSVNFGGGPNVGQFAASGRGEDVSRYLPVNNTGNTAVNNPVNNPVNNALSYRQPPAGVREGGLIIMGKGAVTLVNEFGDTLAVIDNLSLRAQPDGSYEFFGDKKAAGANGSYVRSEVGGRIGYDGAGQWIVDGHFFQESDSAGVHKSFPGQINGRAPKADMASAADGISGTLKGWIAQDKSGNGFVTQPANTNPACDPTRADCAVNTNPACDPAKGDCNTCPAGQVCNNNPVNNNPTTSFGKPFMAGAPNFRMNLERYGYKAGDWFYVSLGGRVYRVKNDSDHVYNSLAPMCGQVVLVPEAIPAKDESDAAKAAFAADGLSLRTTESNRIFLMEDQFAAGVPGRLDKAFDAQGEIRANVFVVELRPLPADYGKSAINCNNGPVVNQPCDPAKGVCNPVDTAKVCDPTRGPCGNDKPPFYVGGLDPLKPILESTGNTIGVIKDSLNSPYIKVKVNPASLRVDQATRVVMVSDEANASQYAVLASPSEPGKPLLRDGFPLAVLQPNQNPPIDNPNNPVDTAKPPVNNQPVVGDTSRPVPYAGTLDNLKTLLVQKSGVVMIATPNGAGPARVNVESLKLDGALYVASDINNGAMVYVFMAPSADPGKVMIGPDGNILVTPKQGVPPLTGL
jgi:hypothetical protein